MSSLGHQGEVLDAVLELRDEAALDRSGTFNPALALSLHQLSVHQTNIGHREEALEAARECVAIREDLVRDQPDVFNSDLASSLAIFSKCLSNLGLREEALAAHEKAEGILALQ